MKKNLTLTIFWALIFVFVWVMCLIIAPAVRDLARPFFKISVIVLVALGIALLIFAIKEKTGGRLKKFLILTGASAVGAFIFSILHNLVYGLFIYFFGQDFWDRIGLGDEPVFFFLALVACPIAFLVGAIGAIILLIKKKKGGDANG